MKRYISTKERKYYTFMLELIMALGGNDLKYKWLISDIEAYPDKETRLKDHLILSNAELIQMLSENNFQWIWAVFSAIPENVSNDEILKFELPSAENNENIYKDDVAIIQHPLAEMEIVAMDSSSVFIVAKDEQMAERFKKLFPKARTNY